jgi:hypothetical protein
MEATATDHSPTLEVVERQFTAWRSRRIGRERIPAKLWQSAVELCATQPITRVCQRLRLSFTDLKKRLEQKTPASIRFVELDLSQPAGTWRLECERPDGARLGTKMGVRSGLGIKLKSRKM